MVSPIAEISHLTLTARSNMVSFVDSLVAPMSLINALIIAVGMGKRSETRDYFEKLEDIWTRYNVYNVSGKG
jgi:DNA-binding MurR/RpiR family transcriptional regulator